MTILDVAKHLGVSWDVVKDIQKRYLSRKYKRLRLKHVTHIAIDEISIGKGHRYLTVVLNLKTGAAIFVGDGKGGDALTPFWKRLKYAKAEIKAVAIDMSPAFIAAVLKICLKEDLKRVWLQVCKVDAKEILDEWIKKARSTIITILKKFANTLASHAFGILNHYDYPISTGPLEVTNNKIKTLQRQAHVFRDAEFFKLKIYGFYETKYALVG
ncbi:MAG: transposase [Deltaproteobacteria bacterium]|nr:transposase [Deltaproteobacteria bacterium]